MIIPVPQWFGDYFEERRNMPFSKWRVLHYYIYIGRRSSAQIFFCNDRWYLDTSPKSGKAIEFAAKMDRRKEK